MCAECETYFEWDGAVVSDKDEFIIVCGQGGTYGFISKKAARCECKHLDDSGREVCCGTGNLTTRYGNN